MHSQCKHSRLDIVAFLLNNRMLSSHLGANSVRYKDTKNLLRFFLWRKLNQTDVVSRHTWEWPQWACPGSLWKRTQTWLRWRQLRSVYNKHIGVVEVPLKKSFVYNICDTDIVFKSGNKNQIRYSVEECAVSAFTGQTTRAGILYT